eukprot:gene7908-9284_t
MKRLVRKRDYRYEFTMVDGFNVWLKCKRGYGSVMPYTFQTFTDEAQFIEYIESVRIGTVVIVMAFGARESPPSPDLCRVLASIGSANVISGFTSPNYSIIGYKGHPPGSAVEAYGTYSLDNDITLVGLDSTINTNCYLFSISYNNESDPAINIHDVCINQSWVNKQVKNASPGITVVTFPDDLDIVFHNPAFHTFPTSDINTNASESLGRYVDSLRDNSLVLIMSKGGELAKINLHSNATTSLVNLGSKLINRFLSSNDLTCWFMLIKKGNPNFHLGSDDPSFSIIVGGLLQTSTSTAKPNVGLVICAISEIDGHVYFTNCYDIGNDQDSKIKLLDDIDNISIGTIVVVVSSNLGPSFTMDPDVCSALYTLGALKCHRITSSSCYALIGRKGSSPGSVPEMLSTGPVSLFSNFMKQNKPIKSFIEIDSLSMASYPDGRYGQSMFRLNGLEVPSRGIFSVGLNVITIDQVSGTIISAKNYNTTIYTLPSSASQLASDLTNLPAGTIVALSTVGPAGKYLNDAIQVMIDHLGSTLVTKLTDQSYCLISTVGKNLTGDQRVKSEFTGATQESTYDTVGNPTEWSNFLAFIQLLANGTHVLVAIQSSTGEIGPNYTLIQQYAFMLFGSSAKPIAPGAWYAAIGCKGSSIGAALESISADNSQVCVSAWEPKIKSSSLVGAEFANPYQLVPKEQPPFWVPTLSKYHMLQSPISLLANGNPVGNIFVNEPAFNLGAPESNGRFVKALLIGVSYLNNPAGTIPNVSQKILEHAHALVQGNYVAKQNIKIITEDVTEVFTGDDNKQYVSGPSSIYIKKIISEWLTQNLKVDDTIYVAFLGRSYTYNKGSTPQYGMCLLTPELNQTDYSMRDSDLHQLFANVPVGANITFLIDSPYAFNLLADASVNLLHKSNGFFSMKTGSPPPVTQQTSSMLPVITSILKSSGAQQLTYNQIMARLTTNPLYQGQPYLLNGTNMTFLSPLIPPANSIPLTLPTTHQ